MKVKYVSRKISKIRWKPNSSSVFFTGSYDDDDNNLTIWKFPSPTIKETETFEDSDPIAMCVENFSGSVTDLKVVSEELLFASSSFGSLSLYKYSDKDFQCTYTWKKAHWFKRDTAAITSIAVKGPHVASVGEDGRLCVFDFMKMKQIGDIECSDQCSFTAINFLRHQEVVVSNSLGYLRIFDFRSSKLSASMLTYSRNQSGISCMNIHPTQSHVLATGNEDGSIHIWDMRQDKEPVNLLQVHSSSVTDLLFHPSNPDIMYSCSLDGSVIQWDASALRNSYTNQISTPSDAASQATRNPWLTCETNTHHLDTMYLYSQPHSCIVSLDFSGSTLLFSGNNEALYILNDLVV